jgi:hypothetical protein
LGGLAETGSLTATHTQPASSQSVLLAMWNLVSEGDTQARCTFQGIPGGCLAKIHNHCAYSLPQSTQTTHGNEAALAWFAWHNLTSRKMYLQESIMWWQETNKEAGKCGFEELVNNVPWATHNHTSHCHPTASGTSWLSWPVS